MKNKKYVIRTGFRTPETIIVNGKTIEQGVRLGPGEEALLESFSKIARQKLIDGGFIAEIRPDGSIDVKDDSTDADYRNLNFLAGLVTPERLGRALRLIEEGKIDLAGLKAMQAKCETVLSSGVDAPVLKMFNDRLTQEIYNIVILNEK